MNKTNNLESANKCMRNKTKFFKSAATPEKKILMKANMLNDQQSS